MSVWGMSADTILQCFVVDKELQKVNPGRDPDAYIPNGLKTYMNVNQKAVDQAKRDR